MGKGKGNFSYDLASVGTTRAGESADGLKYVQRFLTRYGYLDDGTFTRGRVDDSTSTALTKYQEFFGLEITGDFDEETRQLMMQPRCGMPDNVGTAHSPFKTTCPWSKRNLTYAWGKNTDGPVGEFARLCSGRWQLGPASWI